MIAARAASLLGRLAAVLVLAGFVACAGCSRGARDAAPASFDPDSIPEGYARSTAALMWPGATRAFQITPDGDLYNGEWRVRVRASASGVAALPPRTIAYEERWRPIAHWRRTSDDVRWDFEAVALPGPAGRDSGLVVSLLTRATNLSAAPRNADLAIVLAPPDSTVAFVAADASSSPGLLRWGSARDTALAHAFCDEPSHAESLAVHWTLAPGAMRELRVVLPSYPDPASALAEWARVPHADRAQECRRFWQTEVARGIHLELHDPEVESAVRAAEVVLLSCQERHGGGWVPIGSPFHYRDVWLRDGARAVQALAIAGYTNESVDLALGLTNLAWPNGAYLSQRGQLDGTGQVLWALGEAFLRSGRDRSASRAAEAARRGWDCLERERALGRATGLPLGALLPYGDPHDNELVRAQLVGNDAWAIAGYRAAARLFDIAGRARESLSVDSSLRVYRADFARALGSRPEVPPSWQGAGRDWGNLAVAYPCAALAVDDPRVAATARRVWAEAGGAGLVTYGGRDSLHAYLGADLGTWALLAGRREAADSVLAAMLEWRSASGAAGEIFSRTSRDFGRNLPPHPTSAAALITLVRNALIEDESDTLRLTLGARDMWWQHSSVRRAPTRWGVLELEFWRETDAANWKWTPVPVWTALTLPRGARVGPLARPLRPGPRPDVVLAPPGTREARVRFEDEEEGEHP